MLQDFVSCKSYILLQTRDLVGQRLIKGKKILIVCEP
jgi:hypothetical protein